MSRISNEEKSKIQASIIENYTKNKGYDFQDFQVIKALFKLIKDDIYHVIIFKGCDHKAYQNNNFRGTFEELAKSLMNIGDKVSNQISEKNSQKIQKRLNEQVYAQKVQIGDIYYHSWGYDQTNIDFYQVVSKTEKGVQLRELCQKNEESQSEELHPMSAMVLAVKDSFYGEKSIHGVIRDGFIKGEGDKFLSKWDGKALYKSWYA